LAPSAYLDGLKLLARRELSEAQVRQRLSRKGHDPEAIDDAILRLQQERALDDARVAGAIARTESSLRGRGRARVERQIERAGIPKDVARQAVDAAFAEVDAEAQLEAALARRLRGRPIEGDRELQRLYRYLLGQGFEPDRVLALLAKHKREGGER
jgi:regulatory protein